MSEKYNIYDEISYTHVLFDTFIAYTIQFCRKKQMSSGFIVDAI